jgi:hypothetical protein
MRWLCWDARNRWERFEEFAGSIRRVCREHQRWASAGRDECESFESLENPENLESPESFESLENPNHCNSIS